jgi:hypothetical protein
LIAISINNIFYYTSSNKLLNTLPVVEAYSFNIPLANDNDAVKWLSSALLKIFDNNEKAQQKFATPEFLNIFKRMDDPSVFVNPLSDATTSFRVKSAVDSLPQNEKYYTENVRDLLIV